MRGHVRKRGTTWSYVIDVGRDPATRKRRQQWKGGFRTRKAAEAALAEAVGAVNAGTHVAPDPADRRRVDRPLARDDGAEDPRRRPCATTATGSRRVSDRLGHVKLQALQPLDVEELYASLLRKVIATAAGSRRRRSATCTSRCGGRSPTPNASVS